MAINFTRAWTAASLVPAASQALTPVSGPTANLGNSQSGIADILKNVLGPNYQNLLNSSDQSGLVGGSGSGMDPAMIEALAYRNMADARRNLMEESIMQTDAANWNARWNSQNPVANPVGGAFGQAINPAWGMGNAYQQQLNLSQATSAKTAQAAALSPMYAPGMQNSVGQQNTGASFNPFGKSGWVSPVQSTFTPGISHSLMSMGA